MATFKCLECKNPVSSDAKKCPECGADVAKMVRNIMNRKRAGQKAPARLPKEWRIGLSVIAASIIATAAFLLYLGPPMTEEEIFGDSGVGYVDTTGMKTPQPASSTRDAVKTQFGGWDGSHRELTRVIKSRLNDPGSYDHIETTYQQTKDGLRVAIAVKFRANNALGNPVITRVSAVASASGSGKDVAILAWD